MGDVLYPALKGSIRQAPPLVEERPPFDVAAAEAAAEAYWQSPRGHFETAINHLICAGHIDLGRQCLMIYRDFRWDHTPPSAEQVGKVAGLLAMVPANDPHAVNLARRAFIALGAMKFPFPDSTEPKGAA